MQEIYLLSNLAGVVRGQELKYNKNNYNHWKLYYKYMKKIYSAFFHTKTAIARKTTILAFLICTIAFLLINAHMGYSQTTVKQRASVILDSIQTLVFLFPTQITQTTAIITKYLQKSDSIRTVFKKKESLKISANEANANTFINNFKLIFNAVQFAKLESYLIAVIEEQNKIVKIKK